MSMEANERSLRYITRLWKIAVHAQKKKAYQVYIYAINKYQIPFFSNTKVDNIKRKYEGYIESVRKQVG